MAEKNDEITATITLTQEQLARMIEERLVPWHSERTRLVTVRVFNELAEDLKKRMTNIERRLAKIEEGK